MAAPSSAAGGVGSDLLREGLRLEELASKLDRVGNAPEAAERYKQAAELLAHAAAVCPLEKASQAALGVAKAADQLAAASAPECTSRAIVLYKQAIVAFRRAIATDRSIANDRSDVEQHIAEIEVRVMYLESLSGCPATVPIEEHIKALSLTQAADLAALDSASAQGSAPTAWAAPPAASPPIGEASAERSTTAAAHSVQPTQPAQPPDYLQQAVSIEAQAKALEAQGQAAAAGEKYIECLQLFAFVAKREHNENVRNMIRARMAEILDRAEALKGQMAPK